MPLPEPIYYRDPGDENDYVVPSYSPSTEETVENGGSLCVYCREDAALPDDDLCESCQAEVIGEVLLERIERYGYGEAA